MQSENWNQSTLWISADAEIDIHYPYRKTAAPLLLHRGLRRIWTSLTGSLVSTKHYPVLLSVLDVEASEGDVAQIQMASNIEAADDVVDHDIDLGLLLLTLVNRWWVTIMLNAGLFVKVWVHHRRGRPVLCGSSCEQSGSRFNRHGHSLLRFLLQQMFYWFTEVQVCTLPLDTFKLKLNLLSTSVLKENKIQWWNSHFSVLFEVLRGRISSEGLYWSHQHNEQAFSCL